MFQRPTCPKMVPLWYENHTFAICWPSEIASKSMPKRFQNQLYVGYPLGTLKNTIFDVKTSPRRTPKISIFFQKSTKKSSFYGLWSKMPLGSLQEPPKSLPRAPKSRSRALKRHPRAVSEAPKRRPRAFKRHLTQGEETQVVRLQNMKLTATQFLAKPQGGLSLPT